MNALSVTRRALVLGDQDAVTGWYEPSFIESTIKMLILPKGTTLNLSGMGTYARYDHSGFTNNVVEEGDEIKDAFNNYYEVKTVVDIKVGDCLIYRECELVKLDLHE